MKRAGRSRTKIASTWDSNRVWTRAHRFATPPSEIAEDFSPDLGQALVADGMGVAQIGG